MRTISLQDALAAAKAAAKPIEIRVAQGLYKPDQGAGITPGDRLATFQLLNGVTLKGGYAGVAGPDPDARDTGLYETILSGDLQATMSRWTARASLGDQVKPSRTENSRHVVTGSGTDPTAVIDGFTITAGYAWHDSREGRPSLGGAGMLIDAGSPAILNCCFTGERQLGLRRPYCWPATPATCI